MARTAKCHICGKVLDTSVAYKISGKPNKYFCSYEEWQAEEERKKKAAEDKAKVYRLICDIMGEQEIISTALYKEWAIWNKVADNDKIACYLEENKETLSAAIARLSSTEYGKIRYISTIIRDKIKAFMPKPKEAPREEHIEIYGVGPSNYKPKETRRGLDFLED